MQLKGLHNHRNIGKTEIQGIFEFWNQTLSLTHGTHFDDDQRLTTNMGRKTFCTLAELYTGGVLFVVVFHVNQCYEKLTADMGRMTFCTMEDQYTGNFLL